MSGTALIVVDVQYDFIDGSLAVENARDILPVVYNMMEDPSWDLVVASQDFHPAGHVSFASTHGAEPFQAVRLPHPVTHSFKEAMAVTTEPHEDTIAQMLWPDHCVQGTKGSEFEEGVRARLEKLRTKARVVLKGTHSNIDGYSAFALNHYVGFTELPRLLHAQGIQKLTIVGLATDYCVRATAIDARKFDFEVNVVRAGVRAVYAEDEEKVFKELEQWGCKII